MKDVLNWTPALIE